MKRSQVDEVQKRARELNMLRGGDSVQRSLARIVDAWDRFKARGLQLDEGVEQSIKEGRRVLKGLRR